MARWNVRHICGSAVAMMAVLAFATAALAQTPPAEQVSPAAPEKRAPKKPVPRPQNSASPSTVPQAKPRNEVDAAAAQNPISNMISIPFQNNTGFSAGPYRRTQNVLLIEPVIPFHLDAEWTLVTRWITPVINLPRFSPQEGGEFGLGTLQPQFYFVPSNTGSVLVGLGPQFQLPTATDDVLGVNKWGAGPALAALTIQGPWVIGVLANNMWAGTEERRVNRLTLNPFVNYNMAGGWYLSSSPVMTADWLLPASDRWTVPVGGGIGRVFKYGDQPINARVQLFDNVVRGAGVGSWMLQVQVQLLFPTR